MSYGSSIPYLAVIELLRAAADIAEADTAEAVATKIRVHLLEAGMAPADSLPYLLNLLGVKEGAERLAHEHCERAGHHIAAQLTQHVRTLPGRTAS